MVNAKHIDLVGGKKRERGGRGGERERERESVRERVRERV